MMQPQSLFDALDRNHDGIITRSEFNQAFGYGTQASTIGANANTLSLSAGAYHPEGFSVTNSVPYPQATLQPPASLSLPTTSPPQFTEPVAAPAYAATATQLGGVAALPHVSAAAQPAATYTTSVAPAATYTTSVAPAAYTAPAAVQSAGVYTSVAPAVYTERLVAPAVNVPSVAPAVVVSSAAPAVSVPSTVTPAVNVPCTVVSSSYAEAPVAHVRPAATVPLSASVTRLEAAPAVARVQSIPAYAAAAVPHVEVAARPAVPVPVSPVKGATYTTAYAPPTTYAVPAGRAAVGGCSRIVDAPLAPPYVAFPGGHAPPAPSVLDIPGAAVVERPISREELASTGNLLEGPAITGPYGEGPALGGSYGANPAFGYQGPPMRAGPPMPVASHLVAEPMPAYGPCYGSYAPPPMPAYGPCYGSYVPPRLTTAPPTPSVSYQPPPAVVSSYQPPPAVLSSYQPPPAVVSSYQPPPAVVSSYQPPMVSSHMAPMVSPQLVPATAYPYGGTVTQVGYAREASSYARPAMSAFDALDRNHDGVITRAEFEQGMHFPAGGAVSSAPVAIF